MADYTNSPVPDQDADKILISQFIGPRFRCATTKAEQSYPFHCPHCRQAGLLQGFLTRSALRAHLLTHQPIPYLLAQVSA